MPVPTNLPFSTPKTLVRPTNTTYTDSQSFVQSEISKPSCVFCCVKRMQNLWQIYRIQEHKTILDLPQQRIWWKLVRLRKFWCKRIWYEQMGLFRTKSNIKMKLFVKMLTNFAHSSILNVWLGPARARKSYKS